MQEQGRNKVFFFDKNKANEGMLQANLEVKSKFYKKRGATFFL